MVGEVREVVERPLVEEVVEGECRMKMGLKNHSLPVGQLLWRQCHPYSMRQRLCGASSHIRTEL